MWCNKRKVFSFVKDKVEKRLHNWKNLYLSSARKENLIKIVLQCITNYVMGFFAALRPLCEIRENDEFLLMG